MKFDWGKPPLSTRGSAACRIFFDTNKYKFKPTKNSISANKIVKGVPDKEYFLQVKYIYIYIIKVCLSFTIVMSFPLGPGSLRLKVSGSSRQPVDCCLHSRQLPQVLSMVWLLFYPALLVWAPLVCLSAACYYHQGPVLIKKKLE